MLRFVLTAVAVLVASSVGVAADTKPTPAEAADIKQFSEDIFGLATRGQACAKLGEYGPKAWSAVPNLTELLTEGKEKEAGVLAAAAIALGRIGGTGMAKRLKDIAAKERNPEVKRAYLVAQLLAGDSSAETIRAVEETMDAEVALVLLEMPAGITKLKPELIESNLAAFVASQWRGNAPDFELSTDPSMDGKKIRDSFREWGGEADFQVRIAYDRAFQRADIDGKALAVRAFIRATTEQMDEKPAVEFKVLVRRLNSEEPFARSLAAVKLGLLEYQGVAALPELKKLLKDKSPLVAAVAADAVRKLEKN